jgi:predicted  nucleic acid-binding Zn-ribbon protein
MTISSLQTRIRDVQKEIASVREKIARESKAEADLSARLVRVQQDLTRSRSPSTASMKASSILSASAKGPVADRIRQH